MSSAVHLPRLEEPGGSVPTCKQCQECCLCRHTCALSPFSHTLQFPDMVRLLAPVARADRGIFPDPRYLTF